VKVFIQNEAGSRTKHSHNEKTLEPLGAQEVSRRYPFPYGFVLGTTAGDGLNVDCFVLTSTGLRTGQIVECTPIGLMEQFEDGKTDHNVLAVLSGETREVDAATQATLTEFVSHVFDHVPRKSIAVGRFLDAQAASDQVARHHDSDE